MIYETEVCISRQPLTRKDLRRLCGSCVYGISNQKRFFLIDYSEALLKEIQDLSGLPIIDHRPEQLKGCQLRGVFSIFCHIFVR